MASSREYKALFYPDSDVLINKFNLHDAEKLKLAEEKAVFKRMADINNPEAMNQLFGKKFDDKHLLSIHK